MTIQDEILLALKDLVAECKTGRFDEVGFGYWADEDVLNRAIDLIQAIPTEVFMKEFRESLARNGYKRE